jgi:FkbM family methyltransferase
MFRAVGRNLASRLWPRAYVDEVEICSRVLLDRHGVMVDVGAHWGGALARFAAAGWVVYAFEPDPDNRRRLEDSYGAATNVHIDPRAVTEKAHMGLPFYRSKMSSGISGLSSFDESHIRAGSVDSTSLSEFLVAEQIQKIDFLKIDTEGYDLFVLKGLPWGTHAPEVVVCEFENKKSIPLGYTYRDLARFLEERDYHILVSEWFPVVRYGGKHQWRRFAEWPCTLENSDGWGNLIAARDSGLYEALRAICGIEPK